MQEDGKSALSPQERFPDFWIGNQLLSRSLHAVSLVGYENPTGRWEDVVYLFKNSWGPQWGSSGYGRITAPYLATNLYAALVPDWQVSPPEEAP